MAFPKMRVRREFHEVTRDDWSLYPNVKCVETLFVNTTATFTNKPIPVVPSIVSAPTFHV